MEEFLSIKLLEFVSVGQALMVVAILIVVDALMGVIKAVKEHEFEFTMLPQFLGSNVLPYLGGLIVLAAVAYGVDLFAPAFLALAGLAGAKFFVEIVLKGIKLFGL